jgi:hypothetical protein
MILATIASDEEMKKFSTDLKLALIEIVKMIHKCALKIKSKAKILRIKCKLDEDNPNDESNICILKLKTSAWHLVELLNAVYHMSVNDNIKHEIYFNYQMCDDLRSIIYNGTPAEIEYSLKLLWQLCFDKTIAEHVAKHVLIDTEFLKKITDLATQNNKPSIIKKCKCILWLIDYKTRERKKEVSSPNKYIYISYTQENKEICLKIKKHLEFKGHKVWMEMNVDSDLESIINAIENSNCMLIFSSEKYKQSALCRMEAEYACNLNKPIISCILKNGYKADGW